MRAAWICALVAVLHGAAWSLITPAFQVPDEPDHYAYVERIATAGKPPAGEVSPHALSSSERATLAGVRAASIWFQPDNGALRSGAEHDALMRRLAADPARDDGDGAALGGIPHPPLYYALETVPYAVGASDSPLMSLALMRLLSALLGGVTVLFAFLFLREAMPAHPWTWTVGALGVAFQPLFGFMSGGVNPDALLYASASALFYCLARGFRRGLSPRLAVAIGAVVAVGVLAKLNFVGLLPGAAAGLVALGVRGERTPSLRGLRLPVLAGAVTVALVLPVLVANVVLWDRPLVGATSGVFRPATEAASVGGALAYVVELFLADLPGTRAAIAEGPAIRSLWINGFVGEFGYLDTRFRAWVYGLATVVLATIGALAAVTLVRARATLRRRLPEVGVYTAMGAGLLLLVGLTSYNLFLQRTGGAGQARYLLPLLTLYAAVLALAARGAGRRWTPVLGTAIVLLALAHAVFSQLLTIARYYA